MYNAFTMHSSQRETDAEIEPNAVSNTRTTCISLSPRSFRHHHTITNKMTADDVTLVATYDRLIMATAHNT